MNLKQKYQNINVKLPKKLMADFQRICKRNATTMSGLIRNWIENHIETNKEKL